MFLNPSFQIFGCASIITFVFLALENVDVKHNFKLTEALLRVKLRRTLLRKIKNSQKGIFYQGILCAITLCLHCEALAKQWTHGESNSGLRFAKAVFYHLTMGPLFIINLCYIITRFIEI